MKKKILILMPSMFIGGAERSLLGLLDSFDYDRDGKLEIIVKSCGYFCFYSM